MGEKGGAGNASAERSSCACVCMHLPVSGQRERLFLVALFILFFSAAPFLRLFSEQEGGP